MATVVAIFKNEGPYLAEWIAFHRLQGFDRFLLYDNDSSDGGRRIAEEMRAEVIPWPGKVKQLDAYYDACRNRLEPDDWAAFIDVDEFLWLPGAGRTTVANFLYESALRLPAIGARWRMFGDGGHETRPPGLTIEEYLWREVGPNSHVKQILKPRYVQHWLDPHHTDVPFESPPTIAINHYFTRSVAECEAKFARGRADYHVKRNMRDFWKERASLMAVRDDELAVTWGPQVYGSLALERLGQA